MNDSQFDAALEQYRAIADADPQDAQAYLRISEIYRRMGKFDAALDMLKKAESLVQDSLEIPFNMALVYDAQGRFDEAATTLQQLLEKTAHADGNYTTGERNNRSVFWSAWRRYIASRARRSRQSIPIARCWISAATAPRAAISR